MIDKNFLDNLVIGVWAAKGIDIAPESLKITPDMDAESRRRAILNWAEKEIKEKSYFSQFENITPELLKRPKDSGAVTGLSTISKITQEIRKRQLDEAEMTASQKFGKAILEDHFRLDARSEIMRAMFMNLSRKCICCGGPGHEVDH